MKKKKKKERKEMVRKIKGGARDDGKTENCAPRYFALSSRLLVSAGGRKWPLGRRESRNGIM